MISVIHKGNYEKVDELGCLWLGCDRWFWVPGYGMAAATDCQAAFKVEQRKLLSLDYTAFDQTPKQGWRRLGEDLKCYREAAELIGLYLKGKSGLSGGEIEILAFHAGQTFAFDHDYEAAIPYFKQGFQRMENIPPKFRSEAKPYVDAWNAYVNATIAFLQQDKAVLEEYRAIVAKGPETPDGKIMNLHVVDQLIQNVGKPYRNAYGGL